MKSRGRPPKNATTEIITTPSLAKKTKRSPKKVVAPKLVTPEKEPDQNIQKKGRSKKIDVVEEPNTIQPPTADKVPV